MTTVGDTALLSGGRQRFANTTDVSLWSSQDAGVSWTRYMYSISGYHNMLVQNASYGNRPAKFDAHVNSTASPRETSSYTSLLRLPVSVDAMTRAVLEPASAIIIYDHVFYEFPDEPPAHAGRKNAAVTSIFAMRLWVKPMKG